MAIFLVEITEISEGVVDSPSIINPIGAYLSWSLPTQIVLFPIMAPIMLIQVLLMIAIGLAYMGFVSLVPILNVWMLLKLVLGWGDEEDPFILKLLFLLFLVAGIVVDIIFIISMNS